MSSPTLNHPFPQHNNFLRLALVQHPKYIPWPSSDKKWKPVFAKECTLMPPPSRPTHRDSAAISSTDTTSQPTSGIWTPITTAPPTRAPSPTPWVLGRVKLCQHSPPCRTLFGGCSETVKITSPNHKYIRLTPQLRLSEQEDYFSWLTEHITKEDDDEEAKGEEERRRLLEQPIDEGGKLKEHKRIQPQIRPSEGGCGCERALARQDNTYGLRGEERRGRIMLGEILLEMREERRLKMIAKVEAGERVERENVGARDGGSEVQSDPVFV